MKFNKYQKLAMATDQTPEEGRGGANRKEILIPLLGLSGEVGELLSEYKKYLRDGQEHELYEERVREELGDILWYLTNVASKFDLELEDVALWNLEKINARWKVTESDLFPPASYCFDSAYPENEQLPRKFVVDIKDDRQGVVDIFCDGIRLGNRLSDNRNTEDGYRFHDIFHFSNAAVLGWSPITRWMLKRKRKSDPRTDEVEDGGRALAIEEGIVAIVFSYAERHNFLSSNSWISTELLRTIKNMTAHLEVSRCTTGDWEQAIRSGFDVWRIVQEAKTAQLLVDLDGRSVSVLQSG